MHNDALAVWAIILDPTLGFFMKSLLGKRAFI